MIICLEPELFPRRRFKFIDEEGKIINEIEEDFRVAYEGIVKLLRQKFKSMTRL
jgi:hypothetical protein